MTQTQVKTTIAEMAAMPIYSKQWFNAAFEGVNVTDAIRKAAERICSAYGIKGQADPGYIANVINAELNPNT